MRLTALIGAFGLTAMFGAGAQAQSLACGGEYTVKKGDTLQQVTRMAYGEGLSWRFIYNANRAVVGSNPSLIEVGMVLKVPCRQGQTPGVTAESASPAPARATTDAPATETAATETAGTEAPVAATPERPIVAEASLSSMPGRLPFRILTGTDWAPFTDHEQEQGGMITEIFDTAMSRVVDENDYRIDTVRDWSAHLDPLLSDVAYDFTIPWFKPNCAVIEKLGEASRHRCEKLEFSDPLFEMITGYFVKAGSEKPETHADLAGKKVCRAEGYATFMLEEFDVRPPMIEYVRPTMWRDCFEMLMAGDVDILFISTTAADDIIADMRIQDQIEEVPQLSYITTMHAVTSVNNPRAAEQIAVINEGLRQIREDGSWFQIVQRHLTAHVQKQALN